MRRICYNTTSITYTRSIWRVSAVLVIVSHFVEVILVELADETREVAVLEMLGQNRLCKSLVLC